MSPTRFFEASSAGRLDVMGGIADYSGSHVLQLPIKQTATVRLQLRHDYRYSIVSTCQEKTLQTEGDFRTLLNDGEVDFPYAKERFSQNENAWAAYILGCVLVLQHEKKISFTGADIQVDSAIPMGKGVSSSAALEVATLKALAQAFNVTLQGTELPVLAQRAENNIVGAPCGLMDQLACYFGEPNKLLPILCQPDLVKNPIPIPEDVFFMGIDSGSRHEIKGASYGDVRAAAFMGYSMIAKHQGISKQEIMQARATRNFSRLPFNGYLANISTDEFEQRFKTILPVDIKGGDFLALYGNTIDPFTTIDSETRYPVLASTQHPIYENERVISFINHLNKVTQTVGTNREHLLQQMGQLMFQSHYSYTRCGLGSKPTDELVNEAKLTIGILGAKITGGGSGGTVCFLAIGEEGKNAVRSIHRTFQQKYKSTLVLFE